MRRRLLGFTPGAQLRLCAMRHTGEGTKRGDAVAFESIYKAAHVPTTSIKTISAAVAASTSAAAVASTTHHLSPRGAACAETAANNFAVAATVAKPPVPRIDATTASTSRPSATAADAITANTLPVAAAAAFTALVTTPSSLCAAAGTAFAALATAPSSRYSTVQLASSCTRGSIHRERCIRGTGSATKKWFGVSSVVGF